MSYNSIPSEKTCCPVCLSKYQSIINDVASESTPLLYRPSDGRRKRCIEKYNVLFAGGLTFLLFLGITIGFHLLMLEKRGIVPSYVVSLATRHTWNASKVDRNEHLAPPSNKLMIVYTNTPRCFDQQNCTRMVRGLQEDSFRQNKTDLPYNFIIADDNRIYEGRGWQYAPDISPYSDNATLAFAFLGYPGETKLTSAKKDQLLIMVNLSISHHKLQSCFRILTKPEETPHLQNLINRIQKTIINDSCG